MKYRLEKRTDGYLLGIGFNKIAKTLHIFLFNYELEVQLKHD